MEPPTLVWVGLVVTDVAATALTLARDFGLTRGDWAADPGGRTIPVLGVGACALALFTPADPLLGGAAAPGVHHLALGVPDLARAAQEAAELGLRPAAAEPGLAGARRVALALGATAGVRTWLTEAVPAPGPGGGRVARLDHVGAALADNAAALDAFTTRLGCPIESTQTDLEARIPVESFTSDRYGVVQHAREPELVGGLRVAFVTVGDADLELLEDFDPRHPAVVAGEGPGTTRKDRSAIARFVATRGGGLHHLAFRVTDVDRALERLARAGHTLLDPRGRPGSRRARIGFLHPKGLHGVLAHLVEREEI
ncbi:MAG TPA: hypothetical protein DDZ42_20560 [Candidatus Rokubacteria bacterium]|nr:MAG: hypothetical protein A2050_12935 [Candidatus Rokubacteria bacterium GWA2_73_35]HBH04272.1 hypothetical protein [Candidatus Rokubacteria bacterium]